MNFLAAVAELNEGRCEGIKHQQQSGYCIILNGGRLAFKDGNPLTFWPSVYLADDWVLVNPKS